MINGSKVLHHGTELSWTETLRAGHTERVSSLGRSPDAGLTLQFAGPLSAHRPPVDDQCSPVPPTLV